MTELTDIHASRPSAPTPHDERPQTTGPTFPVPTAIATEVTEQMTEDRTQLDRDSENEYAAMENTTAYWEAIRTKYPDWYAMYEDVMPDTVATRSEMIELWTTAPTDWAKGLIYGKFTLRLEIAAHTGIAFV